MNFKLIKASPEYICVMENLSEIDIGTSIQFA